MSELTDYIDKWAPRRPTMLIMNDIKTKVAEVESSLRKEQAKTYKQQEQIKHLSEYASALEVVLAENGLLDDYPESAEELAHPYKFVEPPQTTEGTES